MHFTKYVKHDGYWESICHLREGLGPVLKCRAVVKFDKTYESIVRDYSTGKMVASRPQMKTYREATTTAITLAIKFVKSECKDYETVNGG